MAQEKIHTFSLHSQLWDSAEQGCGCACPAPVIVQFGWRGGAQAAVLGYGSAQGSRGKHLLHQHQNGVDCRVLAGVGEDRQSVCVW